MPSLRPDDEHAAISPPCQVDRAWRSPLIELAVDLGRFALVAMLLLAVLVTAWWPAQARRAMAAASHRNWQPGGA